MLAARSPVKLCRLHGFEYLGMHKVDGQRYYFYKCPKCLTVRRLDSLVILV